MRILGIRHFFIIRKSQLQRRLEQTLILDWHNVPTFKLKKKKKKKVDEEKPKWQVVCVCVTFCQILQASSNKISIYFSQRNINFLSRKSCS